MSERNIRVVAAQIEHDGKYLITQRRESAHLPLLWEFPGGKAEDGETDVEALQREFRHRLEAEIEVVEPAFRVEHAYSDYTVDFRVYRCRLVSDRIVPKAVRDVRWVAPGDLEKYEFPSADKATIDLLLGI